MRQRGKLADGHRFNTRYLDRAIGHLRDGGRTVDDDDLERLSPVVRQHIELHGRYSFSLPEALRSGELRLPLANAAIRRGHTALYLRAPRMAERPTEEHPYDQDVVDHQDPGGAGPSRVLICAGSQLAFRRATGSVTGAS